MPTTSAPTVLAFGAWLKNTACLWMDGQAHWSGPHGDLSTPEACAALQASVEALLARARGAGRTVQAVAHDLHPDFYSTRLALETAGRLGVPAIGVQHHHAHLAAVMAGHGLRGPAVGLALDGVGLGTPDAAFGTWGGELIALDGPRWTRLGHLYPLALPGGDRAAREPWRMAAAALHALGRGEEIVPRLAPVVGEAKAGGLAHMLARGLNCPLTSSAGRWFDAAAGALGLCWHQEDEAQAAIALEQAAARALARDPGLAPLPGARVDAGGRLDLRPLLAALFDAPDTDAAAAGFHLALADALAAWAIAAARAHATGTVCLGGGCFFNRILRERVLARLHEAGLRAWLPAEQGCGDAGLALGQAWVAAQQLGLAAPATDRPTTMTTTTKEHETCA